MVDEDERLKGTLGRETGKVPAKYRSMGCGVGKAEKLVFLKLIYF